MYKFYVLRKENRTIRFFWSKNADYAQRCAKENFAILLVLAEFDPETLNLRVLTSSERSDDLDIIF